MKKYSFFLYIFLFKGEANRAGGKEGEDGYTEVIGIGNIFTQNPSFFKKRVEMNKYLHLPYSLLTWVLQS